MSTGREQLSQMCMAGSFTHRPTRWIFWSHCKSSPDLSTTLIGTFLELETVGVAGVALSLAVTVVVSSEMYVSVNHTGARQLEYSLQTTFLWLGLLDFRCYHWALIAT